MGINPAHFMGTASATVFPAMPNCNDVWPYHSWQKSDAVSLEDLTRAILRAEEEIAQWLGWYPAPWWVSEEVHQFPRHYRRAAYRSGGLNVRGQRVSVNARFAKINAGGQRDLNFVGTATVAGLSLVYSDVDLDGFFETATVTLPTTLDPSLAKFIKVYHEGEGGDQRWEIRPARTKTIAGGNFVATFDAWLLVDPDLRAGYPTTEGFRPIDITTVDNYVTSVDVYREFTNNALTSAEFYWEPAARSTLLFAGACGLCGGSGCTACEFTTQTGCLHVRDAESGIVVPQPAAYDESEDAWTQSAWSCDRDPDFVKLWYLAGRYDDQFLNGPSLDPLGDNWAQAIASLATCRLERLFCSCANLTGLQEELRTDLAFTGTDTAHQLSPSLLDNPFGTRKGEVQAWRWVEKFSKERITGCAIA